MSSALGPGQAATLACLLDLAAPKPGNVHRGADFEDVGFAQFATSAVALAGPIDAAASGALGLGQAVEAAVAASRAWTGTNTHLGTILLLVPLAMAPRDKPWSAGLSAVLASLTPEDSQAVYRAIRTAEPGGLGQVEQADLAGPAPERLLDAMRLAEDRDAIARQYTHGFADVLGPLRDSLIAALEACGRLTEAVVVAHVEQLARQPDSLIARKCGSAVAAEAQARATAVVQAGAPTEGLWWQAASDLDFWLRSDGHRRNPGTTADLVTAAVFALLREGTLDAERVRQAL